MPNLTMARQIVSTRRVAGGARSLGRSADASADSTSMSPTDGVEASIRFRPSDATKLYRIDAFAAARPDLYRQSVILAGLLGYLFVCVIFILLLGSIILLIARPRIGTLFVGGFMLYSAVGTFRLLRAASPNAPGGGIEVTPDSAPMLLSHVARIGDACGIRIHSVRLTGQMNASIRRYRPRFGWKRRYALRIGLPFMFALGTDEIEAVTAHEVGHYVGRHSNSTELVQRLCYCWAALASHRPGILRIWPVSTLFAAYARWFGLYSLALLRNHEFEADRISVNIVGAEVAGNSLKRASIQYSRFEDAWETIWDEAGAGATPPPSPYRRLASAFPGENARDRSVLDRELGRSEDVTEFHPSLARRLAALGGSRDLPPPPERTAASDLLGEALETCIDRLDEDWHVTFETQWWEQAAHYREAGARLAVLNEQIDAGTASPQDLLERASLIEVIEGPEAGANTYSDLLERYPDTHGAAFGIGALLLEQKDDAGINVLLDVSDKAPEARASALRHIIDYLVAEGRWKEADRYDRLLRGKQIKRD